MEALQDIVYIWLPPGINFEYHLKVLILPRWGIFCLPLTHRDKILQKIKPVASHILHHTSKFLQISSDQNSFSLQQFIKINPKESCKKKYENYWIFPLNFDVKSKISQTNHFVAKQGNFLKVRFYSKIQKKSKPLVCFF